MGAVRRAACLSTVICHRQFLSLHIRILSYIPQLPFKVGKFADSTKNKILNGMMNDADMARPVQAGLEYTKGKSP